ncbi:hypothetical protein TNCV_2481641 [Trichonephila clavipes]|nr:hypothetical protein TNCV_2481641 [Trichonephila clavipes]
MDARLSLAAALNTIQVTVRFGSFPSQFLGRTSKRYQGLPYLSYLSTILTRGLAAQRIFRVPPCRTATIHFKHPCFLRDSNPSPKAQRH